MFMSFTQSYDTRKRGRPCKAFVIPVLIVLMSTCTTGSAAEEEDDLALPALPEGTTFDKVPKQIQIETLIVETSTTSTTDLSADSAYMRLVRGAEQSGSIQRVSVTTSQAGSGNLVTVPAADGRGSPDNLRGTGAFDSNNQMSDGAQVLPGLIANMDVIKGDWGTFYLSLRMLLAEGNAEVISRPIVLVVEGTTAEIHAGTQVPYQSIQYKSPTQAVLQVVWEDVGVKLKVTPRIEPPRRIKLTIEQVSVSSLVKYENIRGVDMPLFQSREEQTEVYIEDGGTLVTGGILADAMRSSQTKVPLLGDIPLLGFLFRGTSTVRERTDLYVIMRPTIINPGEPSTLRDFEHLDEAMSIVEHELSHAP